MLRQSELRKLGVGLWVGAMSIRGVVGGASGFGAVGLGALGLGALGLGAVGCASTGDKLRARFAKERGCPESQVLVIPRGGVVYGAEGCGQEAEYVCGTFVSSSMDKSAGSCEERNLPRQVRASDALPPPPRANDPEMPPGSSH
ncbi:MAG TPA: hypothetical protein VFQ35_25625 [Polyangiaceae bacterium]|nr:hypothetical protein [Polyangiaceae bacterium]